jgi:hypothetical protein
MFTRDLCCMIKYNLWNVNNCNTWQLFVWWLHVQSGQSYGCNTHVGVSCMLLCPLFARQHVPSALSFEAELPYTLTRISLQLTVSLNREI